MGVSAPREVGVGEVGSEEERLARLEDAVVQEVDVEQPCRRVLAFDSGASTPEPPRSRGPHTYVWVKGERESARGRERERERETTGYEPLELIRS